MNAPVAPIGRDDFDAALRPGFREATRREYAALDAAWRETAGAALDDQGDFRAGQAHERACPLCGTNAPRPRFVKLGMHIVDCGACGMTYSRQVLSPEADRRLYLDSASQTGYRALKRNDAYVDLERTKCAWIVQELGRLRAPGRFLDVGAGCGRLVRAALDAGWDAGGIEANAQFVSACRAEGLPVAQGFFPAAVPTGERFDAVAMLDVLEHTHAPVAFLAETRERLAPRGVLVLQVPNFASLLIRAEGPANTNFCHGHWNHFTAATLEATARRAGLEALGTQTIISELDRIRMLGAAAVEAAAREITGEAPPQALDAEWLHSRKMGYKLLGFFQRR